MAWRRVLNRLPSLTSICLFGNRFVTLGSLPLSAWSRGCELGSEHQLYPGYCNCPAGASGAAAVHRPDTPAPSRRITSKGRAWPLEGHSTAGSSTALLHASPDLLVHGTAKCSVPDRPGCGVQQHRARGCCGAGACAAVHVSNTAPLFKLQQCWRCRGGLWPQPLQRCSCCIHCTWPTTSLDRGRRRYFCLCWPGRLARCVCWSYEATSFKQRISESSLMRCSSSSTATAGCQADDRSRGSGG